LAVKSITFDLCEKNQFGQKGKVWCAMHIPFFFEFNANARILPAKERKVPWTLALV
jgi:hypothetical protein